MEAQSEVNEGVHVNVAKMQTNRRKTVSTLVQVHNTAIRLQLLLGTGTVHTIESELKLTVTSRRLFSASSLTR